MIKKILFFILSLTLASNAWAGSNESLVKKGNALYKKGEYASALKHYQTALAKDPESPIINFDAGIASYKIGKYDTAISHLQKGLLTDDVDFKKDVYYNLGNAYYARASELEDKDPAKAFAYAQKAKEQFQSVLKIDDKDKDALYNYEVAKKKEEEIAKKLPKKKSPFGKQGDDGQESHSQKQEGSPQNQEEENSKNKYEKEDAKDKFEDPDSKNKMNNPSQSENKDAEDKKEEQKPEQGFSQGGDQKQKEDKSSDEKSSASVTPKRGEMTKEEANALLKQFEQSPESAGLLNFDKHTADEPAVLKDW